VTPPEEVGDVSDNQGGGEGRTARPPAKKVAAVPPPGVVDLADRTVPVDQGVPRAKYGDFVVDQSRLRNRIPNGRIPRNERVKIRRKTVVERKQDVVGHHQVPVHLLDHRRLIRANMNDEGSDHVRRRHQAEVAIVPMTSVVASEIPNQVQEGLPIEMPVLHLMQTTSQNEIGDYQRVVVAVPVGPTEAELHHHPGRPTVVHPSVLGPAKPVMSRLTCNV
jgi:hypothetical protein